MTSQRDAILSGASRAAELHAELGLRKQLTAGDRPVDVMDVMRELGITLLFRPLNSLLGAYLPGANAPGVLITTQRDLHVQRFTAAHELGHHVLSHMAASLDTDVGYVGRGEPANYDNRELEADSFAAEFLLPKWLIVAHAKRHQWGRNDLKNPDTVYQLSLRLGASYSATCWALLSNMLVDRPTVNALVNTPPKACKQRALPDFEPESWRRDVWLLSERDRGVRVLGNPNDLLVLVLEEHVSSGYVWDVEPITKAGLQIEKDERQDLADGAIGGPVSRRVVAHGAAQGHIRLEERRPWSKADDAHSTFEIDLAMVGNQPEGLPSWERLIAA
jgi:Zn-dependent peptidase ImmA (M78 family)/predicted secreted protein